jgi:hypothetical protein
MDMNRTLGLAGLLTLQGITTPCAQALRFAEVQSLISERAITTVDGFIKALPEPLRAQYTLVFSSRSLQDASYANPRAVLFGDDATLVLTFNGDPTARGYDAVETMEFDTATASFRFREIQFNGTGAPPTISDANPSRCSACHGSPARPVWDTPPSWPGVYGERYLRGLSAEEEKGIREFLAIQPTHARYKSLIAPDRFAERDTYVTSSSAAYNGRTAEPPNARLSSLLARLNTRAIMARLASSPGYVSHRYVLLAAVEGDCGPLDEFYPRSLRAPLGIQLREYLASHARIDAQQDASKVRRLGGAEAPPPRSTRPVDMGQLRFVVERGLGVSTDSWTLALESNTYDLVAPPGTFSVREALFQDVAATDGALAAQRQYRTFGPSDAYCRLLADRSRQALEEWYVPQPVVLPVATRHDTDAHAVAAVESAVPPTVSLCATCHTGEVAPQIPFGNPGELALRLGGGGYPHGRLLDEVLYRLSAAAGKERMPRGTLLADERVQALKAYFVGLANEPGR